MKTNNLNVLTYGYSYWGYPPNWFRNIKQFFRNIKYAYQRITRGYCNQDIWDLDSFYSELFYQTLNKLADTTIGYPGIDEFSDDRGGFEAWQQYLKDMARHFKNTQEWDETIPINKEVSDAFKKMHSYISNSYFEPVDSTSSRLVEEYSDWDQYEIARQYWLDKEQLANNFRQSEKDLACDMLKKYFFSLWD